MERTLRKNRQKTGRTRRTRGRIVITTDRPRLSVYRTLKHIRGQVVSHDGTVLVTASDQELKDKKLTGVERATATGKMLAEKAKAKKIEAVVFDKSHYKYHGRVKAFADGAREGGLVF